MGLIAFLTVGFATAYGLVEAYYLWSGQPTISKRVQIWGRENFQIWSGLVALLFGLIGWLLAHFSSLPG